MKFKTITSIINEAKEDDLFKCYLAVKRSSGHRWWSYKGFAGNKYFIQVTEDNINDIKIDPSFPILNYSNGIVKEMLKNGAKIENVYNKPEYIEQSGSKKVFHQNVGNDENLPDTVFTKEDALKLGFPIIAKPTDGHSGIGIQVFKNKEEFEKADHSKIDLYSEFIDKAYEHRFFCFKGKPFFWMERKPINDKAKSGTGSSDEKMSFQYIKRNVESIPKNYFELLEKYTALISDLPYICFDVMEDKDGKLYIIESNSQPGVPFDSTVQIYKEVFKDFYKRAVNQKTSDILDGYSEELNKKTLDSEEGRFKIDMK